MPMQVAAAHRQRRQRAVGASVDARAHRPQRLDDPAHRALHERVVAGEHAEERASGEQAAQECACVVPELPQSTTPARLGERVDAAAVDR